MNQADQGTLEGTLLQLEPVLTPPAKKSLGGLRELLELFPNQSLAEIAKTVKSLLDAAQNSLPVVTRRVKEAVEGTSDEPVDKIVASLGKLNAAELKKLGKSLGFELEGKKAELVDGLASWLRSGGQVRPKTKEDRLREAAASYIEEAKPLMQHVDPAVADKLLSIVNRANRDRALGKDGFEIFARQIGITVSGSKAQMKSQVEGFINRLATTYVQTHG